MSAQATLTWILGETVPRKTKTKTLEVFVIGEKKEKIISDTVHSHFF